MVLAVSASTTLSQIKLHVERRAGFAPERQTMVHFGRHLVEGTLSGQGVRDLSTITCFIDVGNPSDGEESGGDDEDAGPRSDPESDHDGPGGGGNNDHGGGGNDHGGGGNDDHGGGDHDPGGNHEASDGEHQVNLQETSRQIYIRLPDNQTIVMDVKGTDTICMIKKFMYDREAISEDELHLTYGIRSLEDDRTLDEYEIRGSTIFAQCGAAAVVQKSECGAAAVDQVVLQPAGATLSKRCSAPARMRQ